MSVKSRLQKAKELVNIGEYKIASKELLSLDSKIKDTNLRLELIDACLAALDHVNENKKLISLCKEGEKLSSSIQRQDLTAFFMGRRADLITMQSTFLWHEKKNLKLMPEWIEFATIREQERYKKLSEKIKKNEDEVDNLFEKSIKIATDINKPEILARILMSRASVMSTRYLSEKNKNINGRLKQKLWLNLNFLRYPFFENILFIPWSKKSKLKNIYNSYFNDFIKSAEIFEKLKDPMSGYAYCNLANNLTTTYKFKLANKYLKKADHIAERYSDQALKKRIVILKQKIKEKNRDIPDYTNGESRDNL
jgi:hypothetical protein